MKHLLILACVFVLSAIALTVITMRDLSAQESSNGTINRENVYVVCRCSLQPWIKENCQVDNFGKKCASGYGINCSENDKKCK